MTAWPAMGSLAAGMMLRAAPAAADTGAPHWPWVDPATLLTLHGVIMAACWGILIPVSIVITRFFKVMPGQDYPAVTDAKFWMRSHRALSTLVIWGGTAGALLPVWALGGITLASTHGQWGAAVIVLGWLQLAIAMSRGTHGGPWGLGNPERMVLPKAQWRGDHYDMTRRRRIFEALHINPGHATWAAGLVAVFLGIDQLGLDWPWPTALAGFLGVLAVASVKFTRDGRRVPTYQAIWGVGEEHPGNKTGDSI